MAPVFDRRAIAGFRDSEDFEFQFGVSLEAAARVHADFVMALEREPAQLRINFRDERALMSCVASVEGDDAQRGRGFPTRTSMLRRGHLRWA